MDLDESQYMLDWCTDDLPSYVPNESETIDPALLQNSVAPLDFALGQEEQLELLGWNEQSGPDQAPATEPPAQ